MAEPMQTPAEQALAQMQSPGYLALDPRIKALAQPGMNPADFFPQGRISNPISAGLDVLAYAMIAKQERQRRAELERLSAERSKGRADYLSQLMSQAGAGGEGLDTGVLAQALLTSGDPDLQQSGIDLAVSSARSRKSQRDQQEMFQNVFGTGEQGQMTEALMGMDPRDPRYAALYSQFGRQEKYDPKTGTYATWYEQPANFPVPSAPTPDFAREWLTGPGVEPTSRAFRIDMEGLAAGTRVATVERRADGMYTIRYADGSVHPVGKGEAAAEQANTAAALANSAAYGEQPVVPSTVQVGTPAPAKGEKPLDIARLPQAFQEEVTARQSLLNTMDRMYAISRDQGKWDRIRKVLDRVSTIAVASNDGALAWLKQEMKNQPDISDFFQGLAAVQNLQFKSLGGQNVTQSEAQRYAPYIPQLTDAPDVLLQKIGGLYKLGIEEYDSQIKNWEKQRYLLPDPFTTPNKSALINLSGQQQTKPGTDPDVLRRRQMRQGVQ